MSRFLLIFALAAAALTQSAQARSPMPAPLLCDNNGRCILPAPQIATRARHDHLRLRHIAKLRSVRPPRRTHLLDANGNPALVTVSTLAGIDITVAPRMVSRIQGFVADLSLVKGYVPRRLKCYSWAPSHVANSLHHTGEACDFDQSGWGHTARAMYHVRDLAKKWGLRDGCSFGDCGHIDDGNTRHVRGRAPWPRLVQTARKP
jgi:hypothetical protein